MSQESPAGVAPRGGCDVCKSDWKQPSGKDNKDERRWERQERAHLVSCGMDKFKEKLEHKYLSH